MDKTKALLIVACAALAGVVVWQQSADRKMFAPPAPLQVTAPEAPAGAASTTVPAAPPVSEPVVAPRAAAPSRASTAAPKKPAPRRETRPVPAAADSAPRSAALVPARETPIATPAPAAVAEHRVAVTDVVDAQAALRQKGGDYRQAGELLDTALRSGSKASFTIIHDHSKGNFEKDPKASCVGELILSPTDIAFEGAGTGDGHHFEASWSEVLEAGSNRFFGSGIGGFHLAINPEGKYQNFNLAPKSKDKAEAKMLVDLLLSNRQTRQKGDRGK